MTITADTTEVAAQFDALSNPVRLRLARLIAETGGTLTVDGLKEHLDESDIGYHLRRLYKAGILTRSTRGYFTYYAICPEAIKDMQHELDRLLWQHAQAAAKARQM